MLAHEILRLLAEKHAEDVFVPECKDGPSYSADYLRMDAWVMTKSWARPCVTVYEIKVDRADFLKDGKWHHYLAYCNQFYFVCPSAVISPDETPPAAGLMLVTSNAGRVYVKKKAPYRQLKIPDRIFRYILMSRAKITRDYRSQQSGADFWRQWMAQRDEEKSLGHAASRKIATLLRNRIAASETENLRLRKLIDGYAEIGAYLREIGLDPDNNWQACRNQVEHRLNVLRQSRVPGLLRVAENLHTKLLHFVSELEEIQSQSATR